MNRAFLGSRAGRGLVALFFCLSTGLWTAAPAGAADPASGAQAPSTAAQAPTPAAPTPPVQPRVKGIYVNTSIAGDSAAFQQILDLLDRTELNAVVVDVKTDWGNVSFATDEPMVREVGAIHPYIDDIAGFLETLRVHRVYRIARIVSFKDGPAVTAHPEWAAQDVNGGVWKDSNGMTWLDPYNHKAWEYVVGVARAAARAGFDEIQFDYVRFPTDGDLSSVYYPADDGRSPRQVIADFLAYARTELHKEGVKVSADVFGLVTSARDDMGIGQRLEEIAGSADYVSPMLYPSHYSKGNLGIANPNSEPYETVHRSLEDATERLADAGLTGKTEVRPWLQDFSWGYTYGPAEVRAQIQAVQDSGSNDWLLWNAAGDYTAAALRGKSLTTDDPFLLSPGEVGPAVTITVNQHPLANDAQTVRPFQAMTSGRTVVPLRLLAEALGAKVDWDNATRTATVTYGGHVALVPVGGRQAAVDGRPVPLDQPALLWQGRVVVPLRFLAEALGATVVWDATTRQVHVFLEPSGL